jgi:hypothetical protein
MLVVYLGVETREGEIGEKGEGYPGLHCWLFPIEGNWSLTLTGPPADLCVRDKMRSTSQPGVVVQTAIPALGRHRQENHKFQGKGTSETLSQKPNRNNKSGGVAHAGVFCLVYMGPWVQFKYKK